MLSPQAESFAAFVTRKRKEHNMTMRSLANILGVSSPYLYDVEQGHRNPLKKENLEKMAAFFELDEEETALMFDLAGIDRGIVPLDLPDYILNNAYVRVALRKAKSKNIKEEEWQKFIAQMDQSEDTH
jgi:transcriptional regulator with XRE-family HTH domain